MNAIKRALALMVIISSLVVMSVQQHDLLIAFFLLALLTGGTMNCIACYKYDGKMPVYSKHIPVYHTDTHIKVDKRVWIGDWIPIRSSVWSPGDFLIIGSVIIAIVVFVKYFI